MRILALLLLLFFAGCSDREVKKKPVQERTKTSIPVIQGNFPLRLDELNLSDTSNTVQVNDECIVFKLEKTLHDYAKSIDFCDSSCNPLDLYINTIQLEDSLQTVFVMLLKNYPTEEITGKVFVYDKPKRACAEDVLDFKLYALYELVDGKLTATELKKDFQITSPEIEQVDYNKDGRTDYQFKRLYHNGTFNALHTTIVTLHNSTIDTLYFCEKGLGELAEKKSCL